MAAIAVSLFLATASAGAATITVNTNADVTADDGACTLREAITSANTDTSSGANGGECAAGSGADTITFQIPGAVPVDHIIAPATDLPFLTTTMTIDGSTDPQEIGLDGTLTGIYGITVEPGADNTLINDLTVIRWSRGIQISGTDGVTVSNSRIGTNAVGAAGLGNTTFGVQVSSGATDTSISDNVISANGQHGVRLLSGTTTGTALTGNRIGTNSAGTAALPNGDAISISETNGTRIGGPDPEDGNLISGNTGRGIVIASSTNGDPAVDATVQSNLVGTDMDGLADLGNGSYGINLTGDVRGTVIDDNVVSGNGGAFLGSGMGIVLTDWSFDTVGPSDTAIRGNRIGVGADGSPMPNDFRGLSVDAGQGFPILGIRIGGDAGLTPGGPCTGDCNVIAGNGNHGIYVRGDDTKVSILGNEIRENGSIGIDLTPFGGFTVNDPGDLDVGANELQNFPVFEAALDDTAGGKTLVTGQLNSAAGATYRIEVFENTAADPTGYGEGETLLGAFDVTTDGSGDAAFGEFLAAESAAAAPLSATATRTDVADPYTSEFSLVEAEGCDQSDTGDTGLLIAGGAGEALCGLAGNDVLRGGSGGDIFDGGEGSDTADLSSSSAAVVADLATGRADSAEGTDLMLSIENLTGSPEADDLSGDAGVNSIDGGGGADVIDPGAGSDTVVGGEGDDVISIADGQSDAVVDCGPGNDTVNADSIDVDSDSIYTGCETINRPPSSYKCDGKSATIVGTNQAETIVGTSARDIIVARAGADTVKGKGGNDIVCAGDGKDTVKGGDGNDLAYGQNGADDLFGENGKDDLFGGDSADLLKGGAASDTLRGGDGADVLRGGDSKDTLKGEGGNDTLKGENGTDKMYGGGGADSLFGGGGGKDLGFGQAGSDKLDGGSGKGDVCNGGSGKDRKSAPRCEKKSRIP